VGFVELNLPEVLKHLTNKIYFSHVQNIECRPELLHDIQIINNEEFVGKAVFYEAKEAKARERFVEFLSDFSSLEVGENDYTISGNESEWKKWLYPIPPL
jgi:hypothetical protein